jgi:hypothetical protein
MNGKHVSHRFACFVRTLLASLGLVAVAAAQTSIGWNFGTASPGSDVFSTPTSVPNLTVSAVSQGNNSGSATMLGTTSASSGYSGASGSYNAAATARIGALNVAAGGSTYFEVTLTPAAGYGVVLSGVSFGTRSTATGPASYALRGSTDAYGTDLAAGSGTTTGAWEFKSHTGLALSSSSAVTLRIYGYGGSGSPGTGNWRIDDLTLTVAVALAPAPTNSNALTMSVTPNTFPENATNPAASGTVTRTGSFATDLVVTLASSDITEAAVPATVTIPAGQASATFDVTAVNDDIPDGDQSVTITASADGYAAGTAALTVQDDGDPWPVVISQYYEGAGSDKYIELHNLSSSAVTLTGCHLAIWDNATAENWKTATGSPRSSQDLSAITIPAGAYWLLKGNAAANPAYASANANNNPDGSSLVGSFNGNDSVVLYSGPAYATAHLIDAISFTNTGNEGAGKSFYRLSNATGYDLNPGTSILNFPAVWATKTLAEVANASPADDWYLNYYAPAQSPVLTAFSAGNGAAATASGRVTLNYTASGGTPLQYRVSELADLTDAAWQPLSAFLSYDISPGAGAKTLYFQVKNDTGSSAIASDAIDRVAYSYLPSVLITQCYDPDSSAANNKYLELTNTSASPVDVSAWSIVRWTNQDAENWKITGASTASPNAVISLAGLGTLAPGRTVVIAHPSAAALTPPAALTNANLSQTGNDSLALYTGTPAPETLADVVSFTYLGNEGADKSFVRQNNTQGFSFAAGSNVTSFPAVWKDTALAAVASATSGENTYLGTYSVGSTYAAWAAAHAGGQASNLDFNGDGVPNGVEYFMGRTGSPFTPNPLVADGKITWPKDPGARASYVIQTSTTLAAEGQPGGWTTEASGVADHGNSIEFTLPAGRPKVFVRLKVTTPE